MKLRREFSDHLELLEKCDLSIDEFEDYYFSIVKQMKNNKDPDLLLVKEIFGQVWQMYDDFNDDYLNPTEVNINEINRYICFLKSEKKYGWPRLGGSGFLIFITFGYYNKVRRKQLGKIGDLDAWPFMSDVEYNECCRY